MTNKVYSIHEIDEALDKWEYDPEGLDYDMDDKIDSYEKFPTKEFFGSLSRKRDSMTKEKFRLKRMIAAHSFGGAYYVDKDRQSCDEEESLRMVRYYKPRESKAYKKYNNRRFRRSRKTSMIVYQGKGTYKKHTLNFKWCYF